MSNTYSNPSKALKEDFDRKELVKDALRNNLSALLSAPIDDDSIDSAAGYVLTNISKARSSTSKVSAIEKALENLPPMGMTDDQAKEVADRVFRELPNIFEVKVDENYQDLGQMLRRLASDHPSITLKWTTKGPGTDTEEMTLELKSEDVDDLIFSFDKVLTGMQDLEEFFEDTVNDLLNIVPEADRKSVTVNVVWYMADNRGTFTDEEGNTVRLEADR